MTNTNTTHTLYRFFNNTGQLLYIGITMNPGSRWKKHREDKPWWHQVTSITMETHPTRQAVLAAETQAIREENPKHNIVRPSPYVAAHARDWEDDLWDFNQDCIRKAKLILAEQRDAPACP